MHIAEPSLPHVTSLSLSLSLSQYVIYLLQVLKHQIYVQKEL